MRMACRSFSITTEAGVLKFLHKLRDHERLGVPKNAGTDSDQGFDLGRMRRLVCKLDNPLSSYPAVHVAGTKGKGSVVAFLSNILSAAGYSVGTYTSPHLRSIHERICVGKRGMKKPERISEQGLEEVFRSVQEPLLQTIEAEDWRLTHFEVFTALAFKYFAQEKVDIALVETGLGGARDATNVITPEGLAAAVIVSVGEEHLEALGGSLESVALAKAGIIKPGRPLVLSHQPNTLAESIIREQASGRNSPVIQASGQHVHGIIKEMVTKGDKFQRCDFLIKAGFHLGDEASLQKNFFLHDCKMRMFGKHQVENALTAICTALLLETQGWRIPEAAIRLGIENTRVMGRFQILSQEQAQRLGLNNSTVVLDGAHTPGSAEALASTCKSLFPGQPFILITAMAADKDHLQFASSFLKELKPMLVIGITVNVAGASVRSASSEAVLSGWSDAAQQRCDSVVELNVTSSETIQEALKLASKSSGQPSVVCFTGSLHLMSAVIELINDASS